MRIVFLALFLAVAYAIPLGDNVIDVEEGEKMKCGICRASLEHLLPFFKTNRSLNYLEAVTIPLCEKLHGIGYCKGKKACKELCPGIIQSYAPAVVEVFMRNGKVGVDQLCQFAKVCPAEVIPPGPVQSVGLIIRSNLSDFSGKKRWKQWERESTGQGSIVHVTDVHLDEEYMPGSLAQCGLPACCRARYGYPAAGQRGAGYYGDYLCDTAPALAEDLYRSMRLRWAPTADMVILTGDEPTHDVWRQSRDQNLAAIAAVTRGLALAFPDVPVFPALGNHAAFPADLFLGPGGDNWLYQAVADDWAQWLPDDAVRTLRQGGFYAARARPGLRMISMHTTVLTSDDLFLKLNTTAHDFTGQLAWFNDTMQQVAALGEKALIIGHAIPSSFVEPLRSAFYEICKQHQDSIVGYLMGHIHQFELTLMRSAENEPPFGVGYAAGSLTTETNLNPGFREWIFDRNSSELTGWKEFWVDLDEANRNAPAPAEWKLQYEAPQYFNMTSLSPLEWDSFARRLPHDAELAAKWNRAWSKGGPAVPPPIERAACGMLQLSDCSNL